MPDKFYIDSEKSRWIIDSTFNDYRDLFPLTDVDENFDYAPATVAHSAQQFPLWINKGRARSTSYYAHHKNVPPHPKWEEISEKIFSWVGEKLIEHKLDYELVPLIAWYVRYSEGGWQEVHFHSSQTVTQIIYLDDNDTITEDSPVKERASGSLYTLLSGDPLVYNTFMPRAGRTIMMAGDIPHGVYPNKSKQRRTIVLDYLVK